MQVQLGASLISVGSSFQSRIARGKKWVHVVFCFWVGNKEFIVSCCCFKKDDCDRHWPVCYVFCVALWDWPHFCIAQEYTTLALWACLGHCLCSDSHFEHTLRLTFEPFLFCVWGVSAMGGISLNNIRPGGVHMFCMQPLLVVCFVFWHFVWWISDCFWPCLW